MNSVKSKQEKENQFALGKFLPEGLRIQNYFRSPVNSVSFRVCSQIAPLVFSILLLLDSLYIRGSAMTCHIDNVPDKLATAYCYDFGTKRISCQEGRHYEGCEPNPIRADENGYEDEDSSGDFLWYRYDFSLFIYLLRERFILFTSEKVRSSPYFK